MRRVSEVTRHARFAVLRLQRRPCDRLELDTHSCLSNNLDYHFSSSKGSYLSTGVSFLVQDLSWCAHFPPDELGVEALWFRRNWPRLERAYRFLAGQFNPDVGGFRAYPRNRVGELPGDGAGWLESFLDEKDDLLLDALEKPSLLPEDLERAYENLSVLYDEAGTREPQDASLNNRIDSALRHLRQIQRREADRMIRSLENGLALKLGEGREIIDRIDAICDKYENSSAADHTTEGADSPSP